MPSPLERVFVALGSNIGPRRLALDFALDRLSGSPGLTLVAVSTVHDTAPVGPVAQPRYLNAVAELTSALDPSDLLALLLSIERLQGRDREHSPRWGPRTLDLDLILFGRRIINLPDLVIPHPRFAERLFVLEPLAELAPDLIPPGFSDSVATLRDRLLAASGAGNP
ncbi:MAG: 2-amino-4-hydroxy-6-hydroxymethyldihydropteridine diphosphokinase [Leptolyngbya sp. PLA3]|nr:MAG: 2-amino-4-hydroxy-6-hydroxymethyldihydropteridine diphosphokinase [Cyanobacteria bacterium CYA]MCE7968884.1 2-amino-4-hydroxy-6-hydroxymethyldihydropteridine diphosphokinase [Leptolyngbya sp. PL-A3]